MDLVFREFYPHPIHKVWQAISQPAALGEWLMVNDFEPIVGKRFTFRAEPTATWRGWMDCEVLAIEPPTRMLWSWRATDAETPQRVEIRLTPVAGGTELMLAHTGQIEPDRRARYASGWPEKLATLNQVLAKAELKELFTVETTHKIVAHDEWMAARLQLLAKEKEYTRLGDEIARQRRDLPWERVTTDYIFDGPAGNESLSQLFAGRSQLAVYHFMFNPAWEAGCPHCSFWADNFNGIDIHLAHRDVTFVAISHAPIVKIEAFKKRMGWNFKWVSAGENGFNYDYYASFTPDVLAKGEQFHNYRIEKGAMPEHAGMSAFFKDPAGEMFHTYSSYSRGIDALNGAYSWLDRMPKGRDEAGFAFAQSWVRYHDRYEDEYRAPWAAADTK